MTDPEILKNNKIRQEMIDRLDREIKRDQRRIEIWYGIALAGFALVLFAPLIARL